MHLHPKTGHKQTQTSDQVMYQRYYLPTVSYLQYLPTVSTYYLPTVSTYFYNDTLMTPRESPLT